MHLKYFVDIQNFVVDELPKHDTFSEIQRLFWEFRTHHKFLVTQVRVMTLHLRTPVLNHEKSDSTEDIWCSYIIYCVLHQ